MSASDPGWQRVTNFRHSFELTFKLKVQSVRGRLFYLWNLWKTNCWFRLCRFRLWGLQHWSRSRSRSRRSRYILPGAGAGAEAGADQKCHGSASLFVSYLYVSKSVLGHYHDLCKNLTFKQVLHQLYTKFVWLDFSTWWPKITLTCRYCGHRALAIIFINVGDTVHTNHWLCLCLDSMFCSSISSSPYSWKHSYFDLIRDVINDVTIDYLSGSEYSRKGQSN